MPKLIVGQLDVGNRSFPYRALWGGVRVPPENQVLVEVAQGIAQQAIVHLQGQESLVQRLSDVIGVFNESLAKRLIEVE